MKHKILKTSMKKITILCIFSLLLLCACDLKKDYERELSNYYLSLTSSNGINDDTVSVENQTYDFESKKMTDHKFDFKLTTQYSLAVYDARDHAVLYSAKDSNNDDQVYLYNINTKETSQLTNHLWGINYIIPRDDDYIVVGAKKKTHILALWSIDKKTHSVKQIEIPDEKYNDMYAWQVAYIPQTNDLVIQATSDSLEYELMDKFNSEDEHKNEDLAIPYSHYIYHDDKMEYLFTQEMPQSEGLVSNGEQVLVAIQSKNQGKQLISYDIKTKEKKILENVSGLGRVFYFDNKGQYLYAFNNGVVRKDVKTGKEEKTDYKFKELGYYNNFILLKK